MTLTKDQTIGPYRVVEKAGSGGMATVYKAHQPALARFVALKVLPAHFAEDPGFAERFRAEAVTIAQLRHSSILQVFDYGEENGLNYLVTEFVDGGTLADQIGKPLPVDYVIKMLTPIASALDYAHTRDVVHRDIKPSNVLLTRDGSPVISDFGLARMVQSNLPRLTQTGAVVGTPEYMAPEQAMGEDADGAADRYALAIIAYEMLTGSVPFSSDTPLATLLAHAHKPVPLPREKNVKITAAVEAALLKGLSKAPADRYPTAREFIEALGDARGARSAPPAYASAPASAASASAPAPAETSVAPAVATPAATAMASAQSALASFLVMLAEHGVLIRRGVFGAFAALPLAALVVLTGFGPLVALVAAAFVIVAALAGRLGLGVAFTWLLATLLVAFMVPGLALVFAAVGILVLLLGVSSERAAVALAMPVAAPLGLGPAVAFAATATLGVGGIPAVVGGALLAVGAGIAAGQPTFGAFTFTGLSKGYESLLQVGGSAGSTDAQQLASDRLAMLRDALVLQTLGTQIGEFASRVASISAAALATIISWALAAACLWFVSRLLRRRFVVLLGRRSSPLTVYAATTGAGAFVGALLLYLLFVSWGPLLSVAGRPGVDALIGAAFGGAVLGTGIGVLTVAGEGAKRRLV